ncbi:MAG: dTMP kinase [Gammaproteobacteria bacterium]|nr:dTMP kinase [Gammaproteobacteria bacterium]
MKKNYFITLEGIEGAGKSTVMQFVANYLLKHNIKVVVTREPGGTEIAEKIRQIVLNHNNEKMHVDTEILLYFASRAQHLQNVILPALQAGKWVLCDRFTETTYAYQGGGRGIPMQRIAQLEQWVQGDLRPDYVLLLDVDVTVGMERIKKNRVLDRLEVEQHSFFERIRNCYLEMAQKEPQRYKIINANLSEDQVKTQVTEVLRELLNNYESEIR